MFGIVPKSIWQKMNPPDENNMCTWAMRCLLVQDGKRLILIDTGIGTKQSDKFFNHYFLHGEDTLESSLNKHGFSSTDITDVLLTHLHFDHAGGAVKWNNSRTAYEPAFQNAVYWSNQLHWQHAMQPNRREKASFLKENFSVLEESGRLKFLEKESIHPAFELRYYQGHTAHMAVPVINIGKHKLVYLADLIPSNHHINPVYGMGYDIQPLLTIAEREELEAEAVQNDYLLFFEHDPLVECATLAFDERGIKLKQTFRLSEIA